jgi:transcriptional regulator with XRE-family HTH domain
LGISDDRPFYSDKDIVGRSRRPIPNLLPGKLYRIRLFLKLTQKQMLERLQIGLAKDRDPLTGLYPGHISEYERGIREPPLRVLLEYARVAQLPMEVLVDQSMELPTDFPIPSYPWILKRPKRKRGTVRVDSYKADIDRSKKRRLGTVRVDSYKAKIDGSKKISPKSFKHRPK